MLVKRDFEVPLVREDVEARGHGTGVSLLQRVKGIATKRGGSPRVACTNSDTSGKLSIVEDRDSKQTRDTKISAVSSRSQTRRNSTSTMDDLNMIHPIRSHHSQHDETELQDLSLAATPSLSRHRSLTHPTPLEPMYKRILKNVLKFLLSLISPPSISIMLSLLIALVPQLKALFVANVPGVNMPEAPDGMPPLEWILDIANFGGKGFLPA